MITKNKSATRLSSQAIEPTKLINKGKTINEVRASELSATVFSGDAFDVVTRLEPSSIDLIITSPPYWGQRTYGFDHNWEILDEWRSEGNSETDIPTYDWYREHGGVLGLEPIPEWYIHRLVEIFENMKPLLKQGGSLWVNLGDTYFARWSSIRDGGRQGLGNHSRIRRKVPMGGYRQEKQLLLIPARFAIEMQSRKWILRNDVIWHKPNIPPRPENDRLRLAHEHFFHFVKKPTQGRAKYYYDIQEVNLSKTDVITCNVGNGKGNHSATFPEELVKPRILSSCPPSGFVLDPFCGSGTALVSALRNDRNAIGIELNDSFAKVALQSIAELRGVDVKKA